MAQDSFTICLTLKRNLLQSRNTHFRMFQKQETDLGHTNTVEIAVTMSDTNIPLTAARCSLGSLTLHRLWKKLATGSHKHFLVPLYTYACTSCSQQMWARYLICFYSLCQSPKHLVEGELPYYLLYIPIMVTYFKSLNSNPAPG